jgi:hypothetical protein
VELGLKAFYGRGVGYGTFGLGLDVLVMPARHYGLGLSLGAFSVHNGSDAHYSPSGTLRSGQRVLAFAEFDLLDLTVTPYARLGLGFGPTTRWNGRRLREPIAFRRGSDRAVRLQPGRALLRGQRLLTADEAA